MRPDTLFCVTDAVARTTIGRREAAGARARRLPAPRCSCMLAFTLVAGLEFGWLLSIAAFTIYTYQQPFEASKHPSIGPVPVHWTQCLPAFPAALQTKASSLPCSYPLDR